MRIDYVSSAMHPQDFETFFAALARKPGQQAQKYHTLLMQGLREKGACVQAVTARPVTPANYKGKFLPHANTVRQGVHFHYCSVWNRPLVKNVWQMLASGWSVWRTCRSEDSAVVVDVLNASAALGAALAAKWRRRPCVGVVTDLPELMVTGNSRRHSAMSRSVMRLCRGYVLLTEAMNQSVNPEGKPYTIIEGICDARMAERCPNAPDEKKICLYAGLLDERYGAKMLVEGFLLAQLPDTELHLYGDGPYAAVLEQTAREHKNIVYHGTVMNEEVVAAELAATLLINPRPSGELFTQYSFPSKIMEYMASGTPVLATNLPGVPKAYKEHLYCIEEENSLGLAKALRQLWTLPRQELAKKGAAAKDYVLQEKNEQQQAAKLLSLLEQLK